MGDGAKSPPGGQTDRRGRVLWQPILVSLVGIMTLFHIAGAVISLAVRGRIFHQTPNYNLALVKVSPMPLFSRAACAPARRALPTFN